MAATALPVQALGQLDLCHRRQPGLVNPAVAPAKAFKQGSAAGRGTARGKIGVARSDVTHFRCR